MLTECDFKPAFWLRGPHAQTLFASQMRRMPPLTVQPERLELADGDFLDLSWLSETGLPASAPLVVVLHGLGGSLDSKYARGLLRQVARHNSRGVLLHFRGAAKPNRLPNSYHSGETGDLGYLLNLLRDRFPDAPLAAVGYSLGGNILLKYLGEQGACSPLSCAVAVSVPFDLEGSAHAIGRGFARIYQNYLLATMRKVVARKQLDGVIDRPLPKLTDLRDFHHFDDAVTAPLNGFTDVHDYYSRSSCRPLLGKIKTPTLIVHSRDDPFTGPDVIPTERELSTTTRLELSDHGGHVGFVSAGKKGQPEYWLEKRIPPYLAQHLAGFGL